MKPRVVYWNNIPSPYMVERFHALSNRGKFHFEAWFNRLSTPGRSWIVDPSTWGFQYRLLPSLSQFGKRLQLPWAELARNPPDILFSLYSEPSFILGWMIARSRGAKTCFRVLKTFDSWVSRHPLKEMAKRYLFARVDAIETVGEDGRRYAIQYGASEEKIFIATHSFDVHHFMNRSRMARPHRAALRARLRTVGATFLYVGRLWQGKGLKYLLEAFRLTQSRARTPVSLMIVGDGPHEDTLRHDSREMGLKNVIFTGFIQRNALPTFYAASDAFVFPTLGDPYGLVVDEAMACSLPIISTDAAGEIHARVEEGVNGYIVPSGDSTCLADRMIRLAENEAMRKRMGEASLMKIRDHTPERWAHDIERIIYHLLDDSNGKP